VRLLLDTAVLLWWLAADRRLSQQAASVIAAPGSAVSVSAASAWEIEIKRALGRLTAPDDLPAALNDSGFEALPVELAHAIAAGRLPPLHADPFDRMLVAQARLEAMTLVTADREIARYDVHVLAA
jgi:PIN domain nuclease of toxin-antitoxin system